MDKQGNTYIITIENRGVLTRFVTHDEKRAKEFMAAIVYAVCSKVTIENISGTILQKD